MSANTTNQTYTVKEVSSLTGLPASTLRYYEDIGVIGPITRGSTSKQRVYSEEDLGVLDAIVCFMATGMSINDMKTYIANIRKGVEGAVEQLSLLKAQKQHLMEEVKLLEMRQEHVDTKIAFWNALQMDDTDTAQGMRAKARKLADLIRVAKDSLNDY